MYDLARNGFNSSEVLKLLTSDRTVSYRFEILNKDDLAIGEITATGNIDFNSQATIKRCASLTIREDSGIDYTSDRIRPVMCLKVGTQVLEFPLGVFLLSSPSRKANDGIVGRVIDCYDKTQILADDKFPSRYTIPAGTNYVTAASAIVASAGIHQVFSDLSNKETNTTIEFDAGTEKITAINALLRAINFNDIYADANGAICIRRYMQPEARLIEAFYSTDKDSIVLSGAEEMLDIFAAPNKIVRYVENADLPYMISEVTNDDPNSKLSTVSRGRTIVDIATVDDIADQASLDAYTMRIAAEKKIFQRVTFQTANMPNHEYLDCLYVNNKELDVAGKYIEESWNMKLEPGGTMTHTCRKAVSI